MHKKKVLLSEIAKDIGRSKSTISRELRRNNGKCGYRHLQAYIKTQCRHFTGAWNPITGFVMSPLMTITSKQKRVTKPKSWLCYEALLLG